MKNDIRFNFHLCFFMINIDIMLALIVILMKMFFDLNDHINSIYVLEEQNLVHIVTKNI